MRNVECRWPSSWDMGWHEPALPGGSAKAKGAAGALPYAPFFGSAAPLRTDETSKRPHLSSPPLTPSASTSCTGIPYRSDLVEYCSARPPGMPGTPTQRPCSRASPSQALRRLSPRQAHKQYRHFQRRPGRSSGRSPEHQLQRYLGVPRQPPGCRRLATAC